MKDTEQKWEFITLRAQGKALTTIALQLGVSRQTLANWEEDFEEELQNQKALELDALREAYFMTRQAKIEQIAEDRRCIREELKKRDLSDVPTAKLLQLDLEYGARLEQEFASVQVKSERRLINEKERRERHPLRAAPSFLSPQLLLDPEERGNGTRGRGRKKVS